MATRHHLRLFGSVELLEPGGYPIRFRTRKHLALLVYLALEARDRLIDRGRLVDLFWDGVAYERGSHSLAQALTAIRAALGPGALPRFRQEVQLLAGLTTDLDSLAPRTLRAEDLSRPLPLLEDCGGRSFGQWIETVRGRCLADVRRRLVADLAEARRGGMVQQARESATLLHAIDPGNELAALVVAEHMAADGNLDGAIDLLRRHVAHARDLKRSPSLELAGFLQRLERGLFRTLHDPARDPGVPPVHTGSEVFVGRERKLMRLESLWTRARDGRLVAALVTGPGGIGKSTLLRRFATGLAARGWPAYLVSCQEIARTIPFAAVSDLTLQLIRDPAVAGTDPRWLAEASRVTPGLRSVYSGIPEPQPTPPEAVRIRATEALFRMLEALRDSGPLLLAIDDVQFMDPASREVIHVLLRRLERSPTLLLAAADDGESLRSRQEAFDLVAWEEEVVLDCLDAESTIRLVRAVAGRLHPPARHVCDKIAELSQGNPYLTEMLASDWQNNSGNSLVAAEMDPLRPVSAWRPSRAMRRAFKRQHQGLSHNGEHMLNLLAVAGRAIPAGDLKGLLDLEQSDMDRAVLELVDRSTIRVLGDAFGFRNEPHRAFVYFQMPQEARVYYHARLANLLSATAGKEDFQRQLEASHHFAKAGMVNDAVEAVCVGADLAVTRGAPKEAERALQVVSSLSERTGPSLRPHLARALAAEGRFKEALRCIEAWSTTNHTPYEAALAAAARVEALHRGRLADDTTIRGALRSALTLTDASGDPILAMRVLQISAEVLSDTGCTRAVKSLMAKAGEMQYSAGQPEVRSLAELTQAYCLLVAGAVEEAALRFNRATKTLKNLSLELELRQALNGLGITSYFMGAFQESIAAFREAVESASAIGDSVAAATSWSNLGAVYEDLGQSSTAQQCYEKALEHEAVASNPRRAVEVNLNLASLMMVDGELDEAERYLDVAKRHVKKAALWWLANNLRLCEADLYLLRSNPKCAWPLVEEAQANTKGRVYLLSDMTRFERLARHHLWVMRGVRKMQQSTVTDNLAQRCVKLSGRLEILAFEQWIVATEGGKQENQIDALSELRTRNLDGVIKRISRIQEAVRSQ